MIAAMSDSITQMVESYDPANLFEVLANSHAQVTRAMERPLPAVKAPAGPRQVLMCGMGGSAISGDLAADLLGGELRLPFMVNRAYGLPAWAGRETLVVAASYSGNTEETISCLEEALGRGCPALCITNGGAVGAIAEKAGLPVFPLDPGLQPRYALYSGLFTLLRALHAAGVAGDQKEFAAKVVTHLEQSSSRHAGGGEALEMARRLFGMIPLVYSAEGMTNGAGLRFKAQLNENGKTHAFHAALPEMNHNEIVGWEGASTGLAAVFLMDREYHPRVLRRFEVLHALLEGAGVGVHVVSGGVPDRKLRLLDMVYFCDWVSYYIALLGGRDPGEIDAIDRMKKELSRR